MTPEKLVSMAMEAMEHAYVPYSGYKVGAALLSLLVFTVYFTKGKFKTLIKLGVLYAVLEVVY